MSEKCKFGIKEFEVVADLEDVIDDPSKLDALFDEAHDKAEKRLWDDPEWAEQRATHRKDIIRAFIVGVVDADCWFSNYSLPPNLESVGNALSAAQFEKFKGNDEIVQASLLDLEAFYNEFIDATPQCREWNDYPGETFVHRDSPVPQQRSFIDLGALVRNAAIHLRNDRRDFDRFNEQFEQEQAARMNLKS